MPDLATLPEFDRSDQLGMAADEAAIADTDPRLDHRKGTDLHLLTEFGQWIDDSGRVDFRGYGRSFR